MPYVDIYRHNMGNQLAFVIVLVVLVRELHPNIYQKNQGIKRKGYIILKQHGFLASHISSTQFHDFKLSFFCFSGTIQTA